MAKIECEICKTEFTAKSDKAKLCSNRCRVIKHRGGLPELHYEINYSYLEAKDKKRFILGLMDKAAKDKLIFDCLALISHGVPFKGKLSVQAIVNRLVKACYSTDLRTTLSGKGVRHSIRFARYFNNDKIAEEQHEIIHGRTVSNTLSVALSLGEQTNVEIITFDGGWKSKNGTTIPNLGCLKQIYKIGQNGILILTNDLQASRYLRKEGFMVKKMPGKTTSEIYENYVNGVFKMNQHEKVVFDRLVDVSGLKASTVKKVLDLLGPVISEQIGKGQTCKLPGFTSIIPTDALTEDKVDYESRRCIKFSVDDNFVERVYRSYWDEPDEVISTIMQKRLPKVPKVTGKLRTIMEMYLGKLDVAWVITDVSGWVDQYGNRLAKLHEIKDQVRKNPLDFGCRHNGGILRTSDVKKLVVLTNSSEALNFLKKEGFTVLMFEDAVDADDIIHSYSLSKFSEERLHWKTFKAAALK